MKRKTKGETNKRPLFKGRLITSLGCSIPGKCIVNLKQKEKGYEDKDR